MSSAIRAGMGAPRSWYRRSAPSGVAGQAAIVVDGAGREVELREQQGGIQIALGGRGRAGGQVGLLRLLGGLELGRLQVVATLRGRPAGAVEVGDDAVGVRGEHGVDQGARLGKAAVGEQEAREELARQVVGGREA